MATKRIKELIQDAKTMVSVDDVLEMYNYHPVSGRGYMYRCPFHGEDRRPSATTKRGTFHCFACGLTLDCVGLVETIEKCRPSVALKILDSKFKLGLFKELSEQEQKYLYTKRKQLEKQKARQVAEKNFENKVLNQILDALKFWNKVKNKTCNACKIWNSKTFFKANEKIEFYEWLYNKLCGFDCAESRFDYLYGSTKTQILNLLICHKIKI